MADGTIIIDSQLDTRKLQSQLKAQEKEFAKITGDIDKARSALAQMEAEYAKLTEGAREIAQQTGMTDAETDAFISNSVKGAAALENKMQQTAEFIDNASQRQGELTTQIEQTNESIRQTQIEEERVKEQMSKATVALDKFTKRIIGLAKRVFVFTLITKALRNVRTYFSQALNASDGFRESVANLKGALLVAFQPLMNVVIPAITAFIGVAARAANMLAKLAQWFGGLFGKNSRDAAKAMYEQAKATETAGDAAEKAKRQMSGLDEMNTWQADNGGGSSSSAIKPNFDMEIGKDMSALEVIVAGASLALGAILTFTGTAIPLGIALMAVGAAGLVSALSVKWDSMPKQMKKALTATLAILGTAALVLGAILSFSGANLPLGIGLMAVGAASIGTAIALNWDTIKQKLQGTLGKVMAIVSGALLVLGIILVATGAGIPLGIGMILAGAAGLATAATVNWDAIRTKLKDTWAKIKTWFNDSVKPKLTLKYWKEKFANIKDGLVDRIKGGINSAISLFNRFVNWVNDKMNISWKAVKVLGKEVIPAGDIQLIKLKQIPMLAKGAVIPANHEFMAVLGDQKQGRNLEAPEDLIRKIVREESMNGNFVFQALLDGRVIFEETVSQAKARQRMTGKNPFKLGGI